MVSFSILDPCDTRRVKIRVNHGIWQVSRSCLTLSKVRKSLIWIIKRYRTFVILSMDENYRTTWTSLTCTFYFRYFGNQLRRVWANHPSRNTYRRMASFWSWWPDWGCEHPVDFGTLPFRTHSAKTHRPSRSQPSLAQPYPAQCSLVQPSLAKHGRIVGIDPFSRVFPLLP